MEFYFPYVAFARWTEEKRGTCDSSRRGDSWMADLEERTKVHQSNVLKTPASRERIFPLV
jgi:hypothetical protein